MAILASASTPLALLAQPTDDNWSAVGSGLNGSVNALAASGTDVYAAGHFDTAGGIVAANIAKWNGSTWTNLGSGLNSYVYALAMSGSDLYAGGAFWIADGNAARSVAKWDGSNWSPVGLGLSSVVYALAASGTNLYVGGSFVKATNSNGTTISANHIAKWNGTSWSALGTGVDNTSVYALAVSGADLYVGGNFLNAGGAPANRIAKWNGSSWSALGPGLNGFVGSLVMSGANLYAGISTSPGNVLTVAKWDGGSWTVPGFGPNTYVNALTASGSDIYVGGGFTRATNSDGTTISANCIAKWNGTWSALGSGINGGVGALAVLGSDLFAGGNFTTAGSKPSTNIARMRIGSSAKSLVVTNSTASIHFSGVTGYQYDVQRTTTLIPPTTWTNITTDPLSPATDGSFTFADTNAPLGNAYYRAARR
jgi:hypothetical protein